MSDMPEENNSEKTELPPMGWLEGNSTGLPQQPRPFLLDVNAASFSMTFGQAVMTVQEGYVPDPHDDPKKLLELIMDSASLPKESAPWPSDLPQQIDLIYKLAGELGSKMSEIELGWYLILISLMPQTPRPIIDAIINTRGNPNGGQQRNVIWSIICALFPDEKSDFRKFCVKLLTVTNELQGRRNAAIHSIIKIGPHQGHSRIVVTGTTKPSKLPTLTPSKIKDELESCLIEADKIINAIKKYFQHVSTSELSTPAPICPELSNGWSDPL